MRQPGFHLGAEEVIDELFGAVRIGAAADDGHGIGQKQDGIGVDQGNRVAGFDLGHGVIGVGEAGGELALADPDRNLLVAGDQMEPMGMQILVKGLRFFPAPSLEEAGGFTGGSSELGLGHGHASLPDRSGQVAQAFGPVRLGNQLGIDQQNAGAGGEAMPGMVGSLERRRKVPPGRALVRLQNPLFLQADGGQDFVVPMNVTARPGRFSNQVLVQADGFVRFRIVAGQHLQAGPAREFAEDILGKLAVVSAVDHDSACRRLGAAASRGKKKKCKMQNAN